MEKDSKIFVAGHRGLVGSAILNNLRSKGYTNFLLRTHAELDLTDQAAVNEFFAAERPDYVFLSAAHVGGIMANSLYRADFIYNNLMIQNNVIHASWKNNVKKLLFLGSTCIYPREAPQPMPEDCLLTSPLEYSNEPYAIAKIAGIKMCESYNLQYGTNYIAVMPTNLYGPNDNFHLENSHVLPAMIRKIHLAKCLNEGDWEAVRKDIGLRPVSVVCDGIRLIGIFQRRREQHLFLHRLRSLARINARAAQKEQLLHPVTETLANDVLLYLQVLVDEIRTILQIGHDTSHVGGGQHHGFRLFCVEKSLHSRAVQQIQFPVRTAYQIRVPPLHQVTPNGGTHQSVMSRHIYLSILIQHSRLILYPTGLSGAVSSRISCHAPP